MNRVARKKRDNMLITAFSEDDIPVPGEIGTPWTMTADNEYMFLFSPSARFFQTDGEHRRHAKNTFSKGYGERVEMYQVNQSEFGGWAWRRIVFATKDPFRLEFPDTTLAYYGGSAQGFVRTAWNLLGGGTQVGDAREALEDMLFQGEVGVDWNSRLNARVDRNRVHVFSDRTRRLGAQGDGGKIWLFNLFNRINRTLVYDDREIGDEITSTIWAAGGNKGIGNVFVLDFFSAAGATETDTLTFNPTGTYYWHEK